MVPGTVYAPPGSGFLRYWERMLVFPGTVYAPPGNGFFCYRERMLVFPGAVYASPGSGFFCCRERMLVFPGAVYDPPVRGCLEPKCSKHHACASEMTDQVEAWGSSGELGEGQSAPNAMPVHRN